MRVLWISDSPDTPSGFGNVTRFVCEGLAKRRHDVSILGWQTLTPHDWNGCKVYPASGTLGSRSLYPFLVRYRPEIVIALGDVWWLPYFSAPHVRRQMQLTDTPWVLYFPIDGDMAGGGLPASWIELLREVDIPVAMSEFGQGVVSRCGIDCHYIPHGFDPDVFHRPPDREAAKAEVNASGKFLVLSDSRNQPRKMLPRLLDIFAGFAAGRPDVLFHLHTDPEDEFTKSGIYSYDVRADLRHLGIEAQVRFTPGLVMKHRGGVPLSQLAAYYRAADVHLLASSGEGFGLPTLQAAAAGAVPMAGAYSASLELVKGHGEDVAISEWSENEFGIRRALIDIDDAIKKLTHLYDNRHLLMDKSEQSAAFAIPYKWNTVVDQWEALLHSTANSKRRIARVPTTQPLAQKLAAHLAPQVPDGAIKVEVVEHRYGRLESGIIADTHGHLSDVRIPAIQGPCEVGGVRVLRSPAYLAVASGDRMLFTQLQTIFPLLQAWSPVPALLEQDADSPTSLKEGAADVDEEIKKLHLNNFKEARYDLAQSVVLLNVSGEIKEPLLIDGAVYGVPCVGTPRCEAQRQLWPELSTDSFSEGLRLARMLLTNAACLRRIASRARAACRELYFPDEQDSAMWLRQLHTARSIYQTQAR
jgi:glycosyltransferase involved in cell wall biosynthesis